MSARIASPLLALLSLACSTRLDPTFLVPDGHGGEGGGDSLGTPSECVELSVPTRLFLVCSRPPVAFADAERECERRGGELARIHSAEESDALLSQTRELSTQTNLWIGGMRDDEHIWRWRDGTVFWNGLVDGTAPLGAYVNWQSGEPNNVSTVTDEPERCAAVTLFDGHWKDRACSLELSYFCELPPPEL